ncbi:MAG: DUF4352 domain-containing protein [Mycobacteriales bacterium]
MTTPSYDSAGHHQQPQQPPMPAESIPLKRSRTKVGWIIGGVITGVILLACCGLGSLTFLGAGSDSKTGSATGTSSDKSVSTNEAARDGKFEFTAQKVECGKDRVGSQYLNQKAQGQFCFVTLRVKNIGQEARIFDASNQRAFNAAGDKYQADSAASLYANEAGETFLKDINPGNELTGIVVFDIPSDKKLTKLELHDSAFSSGATVRLS